MMPVEIIRRALQGAEQTCRYHGEKFDFLGFQFGEPRCESCQQPWRVRQALAELDRLNGPMRRDTEWAVEEDHGNAKSQTHPFYRREHAEQQRRGREYVVRRELIAGPWVREETRDAS